MDTGTHVLTSHHHIPNYLLLLWMISSICWKIKIKVSLLYRCMFVASLSTLSTQKLSWQSLQDTPWCASAGVALYNKYIPVSSWG